MQLRCHLVNEYEIMAAKQSCVDLKKTHFRLPWWAIATKMRDAVTMTAPSPCKISKFPPYLFSNFEGDASQTDTQNSKLNIPHYHGEYKKFWGMANIWIALPQAPLNRPWRTESSCQLDRPDGLATLHYWRFCQDLSVLKTKSSQTKNKQCILWLIIHS